MEKQEKQKTGKRRGWRDGRGGRSERAGKEDRTEGNKDRSAKERRKGRKEIGVNERKEVIKGDNNEAGMTEVCLSWKDLWK